DLHYAKLNLQALQVIGRWPPTTVDIWAWLPDWRCRPWPGKRRSQSELYGLRNTYHYGSMFKSFADKTIAALFVNQPMRSVAKPLRRRKLQQIDAVDSVEELKATPGNRLEKLRGNRASQWSIHLDLQSAKADIGQRCQAALK